MLTIKPFEFIAENQASIPSYRLKWQEIACSTRPVDREQAEAVINQAYDFMKLPNPNVVFFTNPDDALNHIYQKVTEYWGKLEQSSLGNAIAMQLVTKLLDLTLPTISITVMRF